MDENKIIQKLESIQADLEILMEQISVLIYSIKEQERESIK